MSIKSDIESLLAATPKWTTGYGAASPSVWQYAAVEVLLRAELARQTQGERMAAAQSEMADAAKRAGSPLGRQS